jgi:hypothetical protein
MREARPPHSIILLYRKPVRFVANFLKPRNKGIVRFNRRRNRQVVRRSKADALQQFASNVLH